MEAITGVIKTVLADRGAAAFVSELTAAATLTPAAWLATPLAATAALATAFALACWAGNVLTGYWSWVDRLWSLAPPIYALIFAVWGGNDVRLWVMAALVCAWGARLTYNFARKGGYGEEEDYRWEVVRAFFKQYGFAGLVGRELFNFSFVAVYQHALIWAFAAMPLYAAWLARGNAMTPVDIALAAVFAGLLVLESVADQQQWVFQGKKHAMKPEQRKAAGGDYARGFLTTGLFAHSRHPNFWAEQMMWWTLAAMGGVAAAAALGSAVTTVSLAGLRLTLPTGWTWTWPATGAALLSSLFQGSTNMTERLSLSKYPAYAAYQRTTSRLMPWLAGAPLDSSAGQALLAKLAPGTENPTAKAEAKAPATPAELKKGQ